MKWRLTEIQRTRVIAEVEASSEEEARNKYCDGIGVHIVSTEVLYSDGADCDPVEEEE